MRTALRAGIALYNAGWHHAAHDAWEDRWLDLPDGEPDERLLHGLIQFTAAAHHLSTGNEAGAAGLARSASEYLDDLPATYRDVALDPIRSALSSIAADPGSIEVDSLPPLTVNESTIEPVDLDPAARWIVARVMAAELDGCEEAVVADAITYGREGAGQQWHALVTDFVEQSAHRGLVYRRLAAHVDRERARRGGVDRLFDGE